MGKHRDLDGQGTPGGAEGTPRFRTDAPGCAAPLPPAGRLSPREQATRWRQGERLVPPELSWAVSEPARTRPLRVGTGTRPEQAQPGREDVRWPHGPGVLCVFDQRRHRVSAPYPLPASVKGGSRAGPSPECPPLWHSPDQADDSGGCRGSAARRRHRPPPCRAVFLGGPVWG